MYERKCEEGRKIWIYCVIVVLRWGEGRGGGGLGYMIHVAVVLYGREISCYVSRYGEGILISVS